MCVLFFLCLAQQLAQVLNIGGRVVVDKRLKRVRLLQQAVAPLLGLLLALNLDCSG